MKMLITLGLLCLPLALVIYLADDKPAPVLCPFRQLTGLPCPFCGTTRATIFLLRGDSQVLDYNYFWIVALPALALIMLSSRLRAWFDQWRLLLLLAALAGGGWLVAFSNADKIVG